MEDYQRVFEKWLGRYNKYTEPMYPSSRMELIVRKYFQNFSRDEIINDVLREVAAFSDHPAQRDVWLRSLVATMFASDFGGRFSPPPRYRCRLLRDLIAELEKSDCEEPVPAIYYLLYRQESDSPLSSSTEGWLSYWLHDQLLAVIREDTSLLAAQTTGVRTWQAAKTMVEWFSCRPEWIEGKHVLELGTGLGFLGIALCRSCRPRSFTFTDAHTFVMKRLVGNVVANNDPIVVKAAQSPLSDPSLSTAETDNNTSCARLEELVATGSLTCDCESLDTDCNNSKSRDSESFDTDCKQSKSRDNESFDTSCNQPRPRDSETFDTDCNQSRALCCECVSGSVWHRSTLGSANVCIQWLDWCEFNLAHVTQYDRIDLVLAADVSYSLSLHAPLCRSLSLLLVRRRDLLHHQQQEQSSEPVAPLVVILALTERNADTMQRLFAEMDVHGLTTTLLSTPSNIQSELRMDESSKVKIFSVTLSSSLAVPPSAS